MARGDWVVGGDRRAAAADRIHTAAVELVLHQGLDALDIDTLAQRVHCSRATIYRYAGGKAHIRDAVLTHIAAGITDVVRREVDGLTGAERVARAIAVALKQIRSGPVRRLMNSRTAPELRELLALPVVTTLAAELAGLEGDDPAAALWVVHVVLSLAYLPPGDADLETEILLRFVAPAFGS